MYIYIYICNSIHMLYDYGGGQRRRGSTSRRWRCGGGRAEARGTIPCLTPFTLHLGVCGRSRRAEACGKLTGIIPRGGGGAVRGGVIPRVGGAQVRGEGLTSTIAARGWCFRTSHSIGRLRGTAGRIGGARSAEFGFPLDSFTLTLPLTHEGPWSELPIVLSYPHQTEGST